MTDKKNVCLVLMPFAPIERPSIALGILKSCLDASGISSKAIYANLDFADIAGLTPYNNVLKSYRDFQIGEWIFSACAFEDGGYDHDGFLKFIEDKLDKYTLKYLEILPQIRSRTRDFIERLADEITGCSPEIVGCSSTFQQNCASLALLKAVKKRRGDIITMMGGANCELEMGVSIVKLFPWVDFAVSGEPEEYFGDFCARLIETGNKLEKSDIPYGVIGKLNYSDHIKPGGCESADNALPRSFVRSMDSVPAPDYSDYFDALSKVSFGSSFQPGLPFETSRGCWWGQRRQCTFCGLNGRGLDYRLKSHERAIAECVRNSELYNINRIECVDNVLEPSYIDSFLTGLKKHGDYNIFYEVRSTLSKEQIFNLAGTGVKWVQPGIESLHDEVLKLMNKGVGALKNIEFLKFAREAGIRSSWNMLAGFPGESDEWYREMAEFLPLIYHLQPPSNMVKIFIDRFGAYQKDPEKFGLKITPLKVFSYIYPLSPEDMNDLVYYFEKTGGNDSSDPRFFESPGKAALQMSVKWWIGSFWSAGREMLTMNDDGSSLKITDLRTCAVRPKHILTGADRRVYEACETSKSEEKIFESVTKTDDKISSPDVKNSILKLVENKLLIRIGPKYLSLAIHGAAPALPELKDFPGGFSN
ncbi:MAG: Radical SAM [uncultured bacterium]|uniref:Radical SAM core domain-containing protein n=1 Tax=Candidatus Wallbacteria bacterium GWC2_49_35 TaxID=1817813 RepID=A0A1F7WLG5_9BACT|nr:MAG: Radical SAM [uncultured bacterium]OGM03670.1 MAG: hypothetical protein A2008_08410 [Candidatus Wallbacteria bacterium GWC2_49_35]HBC76032.1 RiPP maturation radical SAM protein 1 [Candidatus Wallbacteria bacterium]